MKQHISLLLAFALALSLCGCAATPDGEIVAQKNNERLIAAAQAEPQKGATLGEVAELIQGDYDYHYQNEEGTLTITADHVSVTMPAGNTIPMYRVSAAELSQEFAAKAYDFFFPEGGTYYYEGDSISKPALEELILELQRRIAEIQADPELDEDEAYRESLVENIREEIAYYQEAYATAPEEATLREIAVDSTYKEVVLDTIWGEVTHPALDCYYRVSEDQIASLHIDSFPADAVAGTSSVHYDSGRSDWQDYGGGMPMSRASEAEIASVGISYEEAKTLADRFFQAVGVDAELHDTLLVTGVRENDTDPYAYENVDRTSSQGYAAFQFVYTRLIDGIEQAAVSSGFDYSSTKPYALPWQYETIEVYVEAFGISRVDWTDPVEVESSVSENVGIISFADAADIFELMAPLIYQGNLDTWNRHHIEMAYEVTVTDARLCLMRVRDSGGSRTGVLTPAWVFYGEETEQNVGTTAGTEEADAVLNSEPPYILLAINAVDGSVIDISAGY